MLKDASGFFTKPGVAETQPDIKYG
jgi:hypothetical protein